MTEEAVTPTPSDRDLAAGMIARCLQIVVDAEDRPYTDADAELDDLMYCLTMAAVKVKLLPGGEAAARRTYARATADLERRGKPYDPPKLRDSLRWTLSELEQLGFPDAAKLSELRKVHGL